MCYWSLKENKGEALSDAHAYKSMKAASSLLSIVQGENICNLSQKKKEEMLARENPKRMLNLDWNYNSNSKYD